MLVGSPKVCNNKQTMVFKNAMSKIDHISIVVARSGGPLAVLCKKLMNSVDSKCSTHVPTNARNTHTLRLLPTFHFCCSCSLDRRSCSSMSVASQG